MHLRPLHPDLDYPRLTAPLSAFFAEPISVAALRDWVERTAPERVFRLLIATTDDDALIGHSAVVHEEWKPAGDYFTWVLVDPTWRGQGVGAALYAEAREYLHSLGATRVSSQVRDDDPVALRFAQAAGFTHDRHQFESVLDLTTFDETPYREILAALAADGVRFFTLAEAGNTLANRERLYRVNHSTAQEIPGSDGSWMPTFADFERHVSTADWFRPEGQWLAAIGDEWVGLSAVRLYPEDRSAYNLVTGVLSAYRGRRIALALKLHALRYARKHGATTIRTSNDSLNAPMLALNRKLGYRPLAGKYTLRRTTALGYFRQGYSCSQAALAALAPGLGMDETTALQVAGAFGGGISRLGLTCGAVTGALMAIGLKHGMVDPADRAAKERSAALGRRLAEAFTTRHGSITCRDLLGGDISQPDQHSLLRERGLFDTVCPRLVADAELLAAQILCERG
jgi:C_GCAxxG_C_C family probable redox protein